MGTTPMPTLTQGSLFEAFSVLCSASSTPQTVAIASSFLTTHSKTSPDFLPLLLDLVQHPTTTQLPVDVRLQAAVQVKAGIERWWRNRSSTVAAPEVKARTREVLLEVVGRGEPDARLRRIVAVCIGKIASIDTEAGWPDLVPTLMRGITSILTPSQPDPSLSPFSPHGAATLHGLLAALNRFVAESSHLRTTRQRSLFASLANKWLPSVLDLHRTCFASWTGRLSGKSGAQAISSLSAIQARPDDSSWIDLEMSRVTLKIAARMALADCFRNVADHQQVRDFMVESVRCFDSAFALRAHLVSFVTGPTPSLVAFFSTLNKHLARYAKLVTDALETTSMPPPVQKIPGWTHAVVGAWAKVLHASWEHSPAAVSDVSGDSPLARLPDTLVIQAISTLRHITSSWSCQQTSSSPSASPTRQVFSKSWDDPDGQPTIPSSFLSAGTAAKSDDERLWEMNAIPSSLIASFAENLITKSFPLGPSDVRSWIDDPEAYDAESNGNAESRKDYDVRGAAERWFSDLAASWTGVVDETVEKLWAGAVEGVQVREADEMWTVEGARKEAVYAAVGLGSRALRERIDVDRVLDVFGQECASPAASTRILRRRIAWLLGIWASGEVSAQAKVRMYSLLATLLTSSAPSSTDSDLPIQLSAARSLPSFHTWSSLAHTAPGVYGPFLPACIRQVSLLLGAVSSTVETSSQLTHILGDLVEAAAGDDLVGSLAPDLVVTLQSVWLALGETQFRGSVLATMLKLVEAVRAGSEDVQPAACQFVAAAIAPSETSSSEGVAEVLEDDAVTLLLAILRQAPSITPPLLALLVPTITKLLVPGRASIQKGLEVLREYVLLSPELVVHDPTVSDVVGSRLKDLLEEEREFEAVKATLATVVAIVKASSGQGWGKLLHDSGCFAAMLRQVLSTETSILVKTKTICALGHMVCADVEVFVHLVAGSSSTLHASPDQLLGGLRDECIDKFDYLGGSAHDGKVVASGLSFLASVPPLSSADAMTKTVSIWCTQLAVGEERPDEGSDPSSGAQMWRYHDEVEEEAEFIESEGAPAHRARLLFIRSKDLLRVRTLREILDAQIPEAFRRGGRPFEEVWARVDPLQVQELQQRLQGLLRG